MSTVSDRTMPSPPLPLEVAGPVCGVPSLEEIERLTAVPERRAVYRNVDWSFYESLVDSIREGSNIHVSFDGRDLEVMGNGPHHEGVKVALGRFAEVAAEEFAVPCKGMGETTWKRPAIARGLEADECYYFDLEKLALVARLSGSNDVAGYPNPDLAIEVDVSPPEIDRAGIYAALMVSEVWRFDGQQVHIDRPNAEGKYESVEASGFLPVTAEDIRRWVVDEDRRDESAWARRLRAELRERHDT